MTLTFSLEEVNLAVDARRYLMSELSERSGLTLEQRLNIGNKLSSAGHIVHLRQTDPDKSSRTVKEGRNLLVAKPRSMTEAERWIRWRGFGEAVVGISGFWSNILEQRGKGFIARNGIGELGAAPNPNAEMQKVQRNSSDNTELEIALL